jgi:hypothetical protein
MEWDRKRVWPERLGCGVALVVCNVATALAAAPKEKGRLFWHLMLGPFAGWLDAAQAHAFPSALQVVLPATVLTLVPLGIYARRGSRLSLGFGAFAWFVSGWLFCIGLWV